MPTRQAGKRLTRRPRARRARAAAPGLSAPPGYVLVPLTEYERLVAHEMAREVVAEGERPESEYEDADDVFARFAAKGVARVRREQGLTQAQLGARAGLPQSQISRLERNPGQATVRTMKRIAKALGVEVRELL